MFLSTNKRIFLKYIAWILFVIALPCTMLGCAAEPSKKVEDAQFTEPTLVVESVTTEIGATDVQLLVRVYQNPGVAGATIQLDFDANLVLRDVINGNVMGTMDFSKSNLGTRPFRCSWDSIEGESAENGDLLILVFDVPDTAVAGEIFDVGISYRTGDVYNDNWEDVNFTIVKGSITVK